MSMFKLGDLSFNREVDLDTLDDFVFDDRDQEILDYMDAILPNKPTVPQKRTVTEQINVQPYEGSIKFLTDYRTSNVNSYKKLCFTVAQRGWVSLKKFEAKNWTNQHSYKQQKEFIDKFKAKCIKGTKDKRTFEQDIVTHATLSTVKQLMSNDIFKASLELCRVENMKERPFLSYMDNILLKGHVTKIERSVNVGMRNGNASNFIFKEPKKRNDGIGVNINRTEELNFLSLMNSLGVTYHGSFYGMKNISGYVDELTKLFTDIFSDDTNFKTKDEYKEYQAINFESEQEGMYIHTEKYLLEGQLDNLKEWQAFKFELLH